MRGALVMNGYWKRPEATEDAFRGGWLHTGDVAIEDEDGYYTIVDRIKDMIISGGFNIYPREVEDALMAHPSVASAAVIGVPDDKWGEAVKAFVVLKAGASADFDTLHAHVKAKRGGPWAPKSIDFVACDRGHRARQGRPQGAPRALLAGTDARRGVRATGVEERRQSDFQHGSSLRFVADAAKDGGESGSSADPSVGRPRVSVKQHSLGGLPCVRFTLALATCAIALCAQTSFAQDQDAPVAPTAIGSGPWICEWRRRRFFGHSLCRPAGRRAALAPAAAGSKLE